MRIIKLFFKKRGAEGGGVSSRGKKLSSTLSGTEKNCEAITDRKIISVPLVEIMHVVFTRILP